MASASVGTTTSAAESPPRSKATLGCGLLGSLLCYIAQPPLALGILAWIGPTPWLLAARAERLPGRRPYRSLWLAGSLFWLAAIYWISLAYVANFIFLFLLAFYLGAYLPVFVGLTRVAVHRLRVPLGIAGAVVWTGLEWLRAHLLTGFLMASLAHTQVKFPWIIQIADLGGEYAVTFLVVLVAGSIAASLPLSRIGHRPQGGDASRSSGFKAWALAPAALALAATLMYGILKTAPPSGEQARRSPRVALIQSDMLADWKGTVERDRDVMAQQIDLTERAVRQTPGGVDVVVWPETMFRQRMFVRDEKNPPPDEALEATLYTAASIYLENVALETHAALLVGIDRVIASASAAKSDEPCDFRVYNSAVFVDRQGQIQGTYDKMHLLPFGEFIPFAAWVPYLAQFAPITGDSLWGAGPAAFKLDGVVYSPNICYETVLPQLIRRQVVELARRGETPDVLVNLTNDAWYWGSSELDMHLASGVFRAVEMRTPLVIAANRGLSAYVDSRGRVAAVTQRDRADVLTVTVELPQRSGALPSVYARHGDWLPMSCLICCVVLALVGWRGRIAPADSL